MIAATYTCAHEGVDTYLVRTEARIAQGLPHIAIVGLPDAAVREGRERVRSAIRATVNDFPSGRRIVVNLSPASRRKGGAAFDLAVAMALLGAAESCKVAPLADTVFLGELGLDGALRPVNGALPAAIATARAKRRRLVVPAANAPEAAIIEGVSVFAAASLAEVLELERSGYRATPVVVDAATVFANAASRRSVDLSDVRGQPAARRAVEVAAAGGHHLLMVGPPGSGKTMLARRLPTVLPPLTLAEAIDATSIHSIAGLNRNGTLINERPFRAPHHTTSGAGMVGGGAVPLPGEISLAHNGVLFLDELPEFAPHVLNQLREPIEDGQLTISRARSRLRFPARFQLVAAMNPCPCGYLGSTSRACSCDERAVRRYHARLSGPLLDRIDLHVHVPRLEFSELTATAGCESSSSVRERVCSARRRRLQLSADPEVGQALEGAARVLLAKACERLALSGRGATKVANVALTIACLAERDRVLAGDVAEALQYRPTERFEPH